MGLIGFGRKERPKEFLYIPRYYDESKERLANLMQEFDAESAESAEAMKARIKMGYTSRPYYYDKENTASKIRRKSNIRTLIIMAILLIITVTYLSKYGSALQELVK